MGMKGLYGHMEANSELHPFSILCFNARSEIRLESSFYLRLDLNLAGIIIMDSKL